MQIKDIPGYEGHYQIDETGTVYCIKFEKIRKLKPKIRSGAYYAELYKNNKYERILVHRLVYSLFVAPIPTGKTIDHINRNSLDNRLINLRLADMSQQNTNQKTHTSNPYKGITFVARRDKWQTMISGKGSTRKYKAFDTALQAAVMYDLYALKIFGEFAKINFIKTADMLSKEIQLAHLERC